MDKRADGESGLIRCLQAVDMALESIAGETTAVHHHR